MTNLKGKQRGFGRGLGLTIITLGIYAIYWHYKAYKEVYDQEGREDFPIVAWVLSIVPFLNIIGFIWLHVVAIEAVNKARDAKGIGPGVNAASFLLWDILGAFIIVGPFVAYYKLQTTINGYWEAAAKATLTPSAPPPAKLAAP